MNSFELNKVLGAVLGTCLILLALNIGAGALFAEHKPAKPGYMIAVKAEHEGGKTFHEDAEQQLEAHRDTRFGADVGGGNLQLRQQRL